MVPIKNKEVAVVGAAQGRFGKRADAGIRELAAEASFLAMEDAGLEPKNIDASVVALAGDQFNGQGAPAAVVSDACGLQNSPTIRVESACASGTAGIRVAYGWIASGLYDTVAVIGVESMSRLPTPETTELMSRAGDLRHEFCFGVSFPTFYALYASRKMAVHGVTREHLSMVGVKNHYYGYMNPLAHLRKRVTLEEAMNAIYIAYPLNLYDCSLISDGGACVILTNAKNATKFTDTPIWITGIGSGGDNNMVAERANLTNLSGAQVASRAAYKMAGIGPGDVDVAEVHDCFTIAEIMAYEDCGFAAIGEGKKLVEEEQTYIGGKIPVNVDGGLKSKGHPVGCTGVSMAVTLTKQLRGEMGEGMQVDGAEVAFCHNVGQSGQFVNCVVYQR
jgi:acetyl-CoA C-acetyltransferase